MTIEDKRYTWDVIFSEASVSPSSLRYRAIKGYIYQHGLRSVYWKIFLGCLPSSNVSNWSTILLEQRQRYTDLKRKYIQERDVELPIPSKDHYFEDIELIIQQDVERTFPNVEFFRDPKVQRRLSDILFIYSQLYRDISYRQGMHELLAPFYWVLDVDAIDQNGTDIMNQVLDSAYIEHDAFYLFEKLMNHGKAWYEYKEEIIPIDENFETKKVFNPVITTCSRIHHEHLYTIDPILYEHLENYGIEPQLYGLRWLRLLFGREFTVMDELLRLWDAIFAHDPTFQIVDYICLAILLYLRDQLLQKDYTECLVLLMNSVSISLPASLLVEQARCLQDETSQEMALYILQQNDVHFNKEPRKSMLDGTPSLNKKSSLGFSSITNYMMNKAFTSVIDTVQKNLFNKRPPRKSIQKLPPIPIPDSNVNELMAQYISVLENELFTDQKRSGEAMAALGGLKHIRKTFFEKQHLDISVSSSSEEWEIETPEATVFGSVSEIIPIYEGYEIEKPLPPLKLNNDFCSEWLQENVNDDLLETVQLSLQERTVLF